MALNPSDDGETPTLSWRAHKDRGKRYFSDGNYAEALSSYRAALNPEYACPSAEKQILLSNVVACRLKIGGDAMASAAVEEAKQCVALNDKWAKGHVRLATAYLAKGGHSNDACNSLQRALALDSGNQTARTLLMKELRRDHQEAYARRSASGSADDTSGTSFPATEPSAPPAADNGAGAAGAEGAVPPPRNPSYVPNSSSSGPSSAPPNDYAGPNDYMGSPTADAPPANRDRGRPDDGIDDSLSWTQRIQFHFARLTTWYEHELSDDMKTLLKVVLGLLVLYVAFGGRFGLDQVLGGHRDNRGNYEHGNAYDRYYGRASTGGDSSSASTSQSGYNDRTNPNNDAYYDSRRASSSGGRSYDYHDDYAYDTPPRGQSNSYHFPNLFDGSLPSMAILMAFGYVCHRFGMNPFHAIWMLNMFTGNRGRGRGMHGMGMAGMGYGMYRQGMGMPRGGRGRRHGWY